MGRLQYASEFSMIACRRPNCVFDSSDVWMLKCTMIRCLRNLSGAWWLSMCKGKVPNEWAWWLNVDWGQLMHGDQMSHESWIVFEIRVVYETSSNNCKSVRTSDLARFNNAQELSVAWEILRITFSYLGESFVERLDGMQSDQFYLRKIIGKGDLESWVISWKDL